MGKTHKFMQSLDRSVFRELTIIAKKRGCTVQDLIRIIIIPDWFANHLNRTKVKRREQA